MSDKSPRQGSETAEIKITEEMAEAGAEIIRQATGGAAFYFSAPDLAARVYLAMNELSGRDGC